MSAETREIITGISAKRQIISVIIVALILFGVYLSSTLIYTLILGGRIDPQDEYATAEEEDAELMEISFDFDFLMNLLDPDMLEEYAQEIVFYVGDYEIFDDSWLWKFSVSDEYSADGIWSQSVSGLSPTEFTSHGEYYQYYYEQDMMKIKMPIEAQEGLNSISIPALFPTPHILSMPWVEPHTGNFSPESSILFKDIYNIATLNLEFKQPEEVNLTYEMFGEGFLKPSELETTALDPAYSPSAIKDQYLQVPGGAFYYIQSNPFFKSHYDALDLLIDQLNDNTIIRSNKIREYLKSNFELQIYPPYDRPSEGQDVVEWFCENERGIFYDFAAAYVLFARCFDVPCRYVEGFNSRYADQVYIEYEDQPYFYAIKRYNLYAWAEIYVPMSIDGSGNWTEVDVYFGEDPTPQQLDLSVSTDKVAPIVRGEQVNITAQLTSEGNPVPGYSITFRDISEDVVLDVKTTDSQGECSIVLTPNNINVIGIHQIEVTQGFNINYTVYVLEGPVQVNLDSVNPDNIDKTIDSNTTISGDLYDPVANTGIENGLVRFLLLNLSNSEVSNGFVPNSEYSNDNGDYSRNTIVNDNVDTGNYNVRVDFNGTFHVESPFAGFSYDAYVPTINDSSDLIAVYVNNPYTTSLDFYIDGYPNNNYDNPQIFNWQGVSLSVNLYSQGIGPRSGERVDFYDVTAGTEGSPLYIGWTYTDGTGYGSTWYDVDAGGWQPAAGPHLIYAEWGTIRNHSYFVINEPVDLNLNPPIPIPNVINRSGSGTTTFNLKGSITDYSYGVPVKYAVINFSLVQNGQIFHNELVGDPPYSNPYSCGTDGQFDIYFDVDDDILPGNYTVKADFNGTFVYTYPDFPHSFELTTFDTSNSTTMDLEIQAPDYFIFDFWINDTVSSNAENPVINRTQNLNLTTYLQSGGSPLVGETVNFFDVTNNTLIGSDDSDANGYATIIYDLDSGNLAAGPHLIRASFGGVYNYSYFVLNESIYVDLISGPTPSIINRSGSYDTVFNLHGYVKDKQNDMPVLNSRVYFQMYDGAVEVHYLNDSEYTVGQTGEFNLDFEVSDSTPAKNYTVKVVVAEVFDYTSSPYNYWFDLAPNDNFANSSDGYNELKVLDPYDALIELWINGTESLPSYTGSNEPESFNRSNYINFTVKITTQGSEIFNGYVRLYDVYDDFLIASGLTNINGIVEFITPINDSWAVGPHKLMVHYQLDGYDFLNYTFIVLNGSKKVEINADTNSVTRNVDWITISGHVNDTYTNLKVKQIYVSILMFNKTMDDLSSHFIFDVGYTQSDLITSSSNWNYEFRFKVDSSTPIGEYFLRVDFNGSITDWSGPVFISQPNFMSSNSSELKPLNISAGTVVVDGYYNTTSGTFVVGEVIKIWGTLQYDNGSAVSGAKVNITVRDAFGNDLYWNGSESTNGSGYFYVEIIVPAGYNEDSVNIVYLGENFVSGFDEELPRS